MKALREWNEYPGRVARHHDQKRLSGVSRIPGEVMSASDLRHLH